MTDRIDKYLDGTLERTQLSAEERAQADAVERVIVETRAFMDTRPTPDVSADVMHRIEGLAAHPAMPPGSRFARLTSSLWTTRRISFQFKPAYGLAAMLVVLVLATFWRPAQRAADVSSTAPANAEPRVFVQFRLQASDAMSVQLAGSFTNWQPQYELRRTGSGIWSITIPLSPGVHDYAFVVDGNLWTADPYAPSVDDGFGGTNSRIALVVPEDAHS
jgi:AMP-activated protein kinase-like protein